RKQPSPIARQHQPLRKCLVSSGRLDRSRGVASAVGFALLTSTYASLAVQDWQQHWLVEERCSWLVGWLRPLLNKEEEQHPVYCLRVYRRLPVGAAAASTGGVSEGDGMASAFQSAGVRSVRGGDLRLQMRLITGSAGCLASTFAFFFLPRPPAVLASWRRIR